MLSHLNLIGRYWLLQVIKQRVLTALDGWVPVIKHASDLSSLLVWILKISNDKADRLQKYLGAQKIS